MDLTTRTGLVKWIAYATIAMVSLAAIAPGARAQSSDEFRVGDRIALSIDGPMALTDTAVVRDGLVIQIRNIGNISMKGVTHAETEKYLTQEIGKYVKNAIVRATPLLFFGVVGAVGRPGFYSVPADVMLSDLLMHAGGPATNADVNKTTLQRNGKEVLDADAVRKAMTAGKTLADIRAMSGDQLVVKERNPSSKIDTALKITGAVAGVAGLLIAIFASQ